MLPHRTSGPHPTHPRPEVPARQAPAGALRLPLTVEDITAELPGLVVLRAEEVKRPVATEAGNVEAIDALVRAVRA